MCFATKIQGFPDPVLMQQLIPDRHREKDVPNLKYFRPEVKRIFLHILKGLNTLSAPAANIRQLDSVIITNG